MKEDLVKGKNDEEISAPDPIQHFLQILTKEEKGESR